MLRLVSVGMSLQQSVGGPDLHGSWIDGEDTRHFIECCHSERAEPVKPRAERLLVLNAGDVAGGEALSFAGTESALV
jgi:hypothetical protein